tara:strand:+ start:255 stop:572 length:318 start_codon:yes stop_codon:yes gene_type:complete
METINVNELKALFNSDSNSFQLLDVRENDEINLCKLDQAIHIPMMSIPKRLDELNNKKDIIVMCHSGIRSMQVCLFLNQNGYNAINLNGGIDAWAKEIDPTMKRY